MIVEIINSGGTVRICDGGDRTVGKYAGPQSGFSPTWQQVTQPLQGLRAAAQGIVARQNAFWQWELVTTCLYASLDDAVAAMIDRPPYLTTQAAVSGAYLKITEGATVRATKDHHTSPTATITWALQRVVPTRDGVTVRFSHSIILGGALLAFS